MKQQFLVLLLGRGASSILFLLSNVILARTADASAFGYVAALMAGLLFYYTAADFGVSTLLLRAHARRDADQVLGAVRLNAVTSMVAGSTAVVATLVFSLVAGSSPAWAVIGLALALDKNSDALLNVAIAEGRKLPPLVAHLLRRGVALAAHIGLLSVGLGAIDSFAVALGIGSLCCQVYARVVLVPRLGEATPFSRVLRHAFPFFASNIAASVRNLDVAIVALVGGSVSGGMYAAAQRLTTPFMLIPGALTAVALPHATRGSQARARRLAWKLTLLHVGLVAVAAVVAFWSPTIVTVVLGDEYAAAAKPFAFSVVAFPLVALSSTLGGILQGQGQEGYVGRNGVVFAIVLVVALVVGASFGGAGLAAAALAVVYLSKCVALLVGIALRT